MNFAKVFCGLSLLIFGTIGTLYVIKQKNNGGHTHASPERVEVPLAAIQREDDQKNSHQNPAKTAKAITQFDDETQEASTKEPSSVEKPVVIDHDDQQGSLEFLFEKPSRCPIVTTLRYTSKPSWKPKKSAWLVDYAHHYNTPIDFIYRSIDPKATTPEQQKKCTSISEGAQFNVLRNDIKFHFYAVISFASSKLRLYYILPDEKKAVFLKSYPVCLGRRDTAKTSGCLTPFGLYQLGTNIAVFTPNMTGPYKGKRVEMIQVFGTRWIPFEREVDSSSCTDAAKGLGIHGTPIRRQENGSLIEDTSSLGKFESDGCIRLCKKDIEEVYSLISTRRAYVEIVPDFSHSRLMKGHIGAR